MQIVILKHCIKRFLLNWYLLHIFHDQALDFWLANLRLNSHCFIPEVVLLQFVLMSHDWMCSYWALWSNINVKAFIKHEQSRFIYKLSIKPFLDCCSYPIHWNIWCKNVFIIDLHKFVPLMFLEWDWTHKHTHTGWQQCENTHFCT